MVKRINLGEEELEEAQAGQSVALTLNDEVDVSRGDVLATVEDPPEFTDQFQAHLLWMAEAPLSPGRVYLLKLHTQEVSATVTEIKYLEDVNSSSRLAAKQVQLNEIAVVNFSTSHPVVFEPYAQSRTRGLHSHRQADLQHIGCRDAGFCPAPCLKYPLAGSGDQ